jgi:hypothetical protein
MGSEGAADGWDDASYGEDRPGGLHGQDRPPAVRTRWRPGLGAWLLAVLLAVIVVSMVREDVTHTPAWWWLAAHAIGFAGYSSMVLRALTWRVTATPEGLRVRRLRTVTLLPWHELTTAVVSATGTLTIAGSCKGKGTTLDYAGFLRAPRTAAEIAELIREPALRPGR